MEKVSSERLLIGCVADDFTGASDIASFFSLGGLESVMFNGLPDQDYTLDKNVNVAVIALKIRDVAPEVAVDKALDGFRWLKRKGAKQYFYKYCSTFDSTPKGNIGPIIDSLLEEFNEKYTIISPALPVNGRTVRNGKLFVNNIELHESYMRDHPITPMWNSNISELMKNQGKYNTYNISIQEMKDNGISHNQMICNFKDEHFYLVPDYFEESHAELIVEKFGGLKVLTGSSGLAYELSRKHNDGRRIENSSTISEGKARSIIISGSCSVTTQKQIEKYLSKGGPSIRIDPEKLIEGKQSVEEISDWITTISDDKILVYSYASNHDSKNNRYDQREISKTLETTMGMIASESLRVGFKRIIVAGGETSGAVIKSLDFKSFRIEESVSPGVPVLIPDSATDVKLVLKSGNFGDEDFFDRALLLLNE